MLLTNAISEAEDADSDAAEAVIEDLPCEEAATTDVRSETTAEMTTKVAEDSVVDAAAAGLAAADHTIEDTSDEDHREIEGRRVKGSNKTMRSKNRITAAKRDMTQVDRDVEVNEDIIADSLSAARADLRVRIRKARKVETKAVANPKRERKADDQ